MCSGRWGWIATALVVAALVPGRLLRAQETEAYRHVVEQLAERVDALTAAAPAAREDQGGPLDTIRVGTISLLVPPPRRAFADEVGRAAWDSIVSYFGPDTSVLAPTVVALVPTGRRGPSQIPTLHLPIRPEHPAALAIGFILSRVRDQELTRIDPGSWGEWFGWAVRAMLFAPAKLQARTAYSDLATKPWAIVRDCFAGDISQCARVASAGPDGPVTDYFTADERRRIVERVRRDTPPLRRSASAARCVEAGSDSACVEVFQEFRVWITEDPLSPVARATLVRTALDLGGEGAFGRLAATQGEDVLARLATTAGVPQDTLLATWRRRIMAERPPATTLPRLSGWLAFAWAVVFTVAASRSTRWHRG